MRWLKDIVLTGFVVALFVWGSEAGRASDAKAFQDWSVICHDGACVASQTNYGPQDVWLATVRLQGEKDGSAAVQVIVPAGVHLGSGLFLQLKSGAPVSIPYHSCSPEGCQAIARLAPDVVDGWKRAREVSVRYRPALETPPIEFDISMMGVTAALDQTGIVQ